MPKLLAPASKYQLKCSRLFVGCLLKPLRVYVEPNGHQNIFMILSFAEPVVKHFKNRFTDGCNIAHTILWCEYQWKVIFISFSFSPLLGHFLALCCSFKKLQLFTRILFWIPFLWIPKITKTFLPLEKDKGFHSGSLYFCSLKSSTPKAGLQHVMWCDPLPTYEKRRYSKMDTVFNLTVEHGSLLHRQQWFFTSYRELSNEANWCCPAS